MSKPIAHWSLFLLLVTGLAGLPGCLAPPEPVEPMPAIWKQADPSGPQETLFVFLPGRFDAPEDFLDHGFWRQMRETGIPADAVFTDAHLGYYYRQSLVERLSNDILQPARNMGYRNIWVVGISLGGLGAVLFDADAPGWWDGMVLIAPFPGDNPSVLEAVRRSPSIANAELPPEFPDDDYTAKFWHWFQDFQANPQGPLFLAIGNDDRLYSEQVLIARDLSPDRVLEVEGNHSWPVWEELWTRLLPGLEENLVKWQARRDSNPDRRNQNP